MDENVVCVIKCVANFRDGNCRPSEVKKGAILEVTEAEFHKLEKSGPQHFKLLDRKLRLPPPTKSIPDEIEEWKPIGWYAAQLAKEPAGEE